MSLQITYSQGGKFEFRRTGTYPRKILVYDHVLNKRWQRKITEEKNTGVFVSRGGCLIYIIL